MEHHIVAVDGWVKPPALDFPHRSTQYSTTTPEQLPDRVKDATIIITSNTKITRAGIEAASQLQMVACNGVGFDHVDQDAVRERGIMLCHVPAQNTDSVSEHAFALYYAIRRHMLSMHELTMDGSTWPREQVVVKRLGAPPRTNAEEILVIVGYGALGKNVEKIGKALGMCVLIAERKGASSLRDGRTLFSDAIKKGTVFIVVTPLDDTTRGMISWAEFAAMDPSALVVNVGRGGVIDERALAQALKDGQIAGAGTDVFEHEPATKENCPLLDSTIPNFVLSPHIAWYSSKTIKGTIATVKANLEAFAAGQPINVVKLG